MNPVRELALREVVAAADWPQLQAPAHLFLRNHLIEEAARRCSRPNESAAGRFYGVFGDDGCEILAFAGRSRLFCLGPGSPTAGAALVVIALGSERGCRVLIGPRAPTGALRAALHKHVVVELDRSQPFLCLDDRTRLGPGGQTRLARRRDVTWLTTAALRLNEEDLGIDAATVDQKLLRERVEERVVAGRTWIAEDARGRPACKLEVGSEGPAGALIEGVYTEPAHRGQGLARRLVATIAGSLLERWPRVGLHVARGNEPAVRAYRAAGFVEVEDLRLVLLRWS